MAIDSLRSHFNTVLVELKRGKVIPFLGSGANLCDRPANTAYARGQYLPSGDELARHLSQEFNLNITEALELARVAQQIAVEPGSGPLYEVLRHLFNIDYPSTSLHRFLAAAPKMMRDRGYPIWPQLIVTTNYDDVVERSFREAGEEFDLVVYMTLEPYEGKFLHFHPSGDSTAVNIPNSYTGLTLDELGNFSRPVILKIHGAVDRTLADRDSFVITEEDYISYLAQTDISSLVPAPIPAKLKRSHFLFMGYSLRDWNLRVILHRIWGEERLTYSSWAIQDRPSELDKKVWPKKNVEILEMPLDQYVVGLRAAVESVPAREPVPSG